MNIPYLCLLAHSGGGNAAHVAAGMYSHRGAQVNMFLSDARELQQWQQHMKDGIEVHRRHEKDMYKGEAQGNVWPAIASLYTAPQLTCRTTADPPTCWPNQKVTPQQRGSSDAVT
jgi:hypothetical protein